LALRQQEAPEYLPIQIFTGLIFLAGTATLLFLRAWAVSHLNLGVGTSSALRAEEQVDEKQENGRAAVKSRWGILGQALKWERV
jgi:hypothetical protein